MRLGTEADEQLDAPSSFPPRPSLPPTLACAAGMWASCAGTFSLGGRLGEGACWALGLGFLACALVACALVWRTRGKLGLTLVLGCVLGAACGFSGAASQHADQAAALTQSGTFVFEAIDDASEGSYGVSCEAKTTLDDGRTVRVIVRFSDYDFSPSFGERFSATATLTEVSESSAAYYWRSGVVVQARVYSAESVERNDLFGLVAKLRSRAIDLVCAHGTGDGAAVAVALVCGWRGLLDETSAYDDFKACGLAHLVAVSGAHLSIMVGAVAALMAALRAPRWASIVARIALVAAYLVLAGLPPSALRAAVMAVAGMLSFTARRRSASLSALALCMMGFVALDPTTSLSVSFALSALSTLGIVVFMGLMRAWVRALAPRLPSALADALGLTFSSSVLSLPLSAALFAQIPLVSPVANALAAPLFPVVCAGSLVSVLGSVVFPGLAGVLLKGAFGACGVLVAVVHVLSQLPYASIAADVGVVAGLVTSAALAVALWLAWPRPRPLAAVLTAGTAACALAALLLVVPRLSGTQVVMLDVGQGDAFLLRSEGSAVLIDTGTQDTLLKSALARHGVTHLDALIVTHGDDDHMGSMGALGEVVEVDRVLVAEEALTCGCEACAELVEQATELVGEANVMGLEVGDFVGVGKFELSVVWPESFADEGGNADSLCLLACVDVDADGQDDCTALFVGDAEAEQLEELVESGAVGEVDLYKVGHHGSKNALSDEVAEALSPAIALVSVGEDNTYGHPAQVTLDVLEAVGATVFRTDEDGDVSCRITRGGITVTTQG